MLVDPVMASVYAGRTLAAGEDFKKAVKLGIAGSKAVYR
jgi:hypothetical protein